MLKFGRAVLAASGGIITGSVIDDKTHAPIAGAQVVAASPSGTYRTVTDAQGDFRFLSVLPDNYSISVSKALSAVLDGNRGAQRLAADRQSGALQDAQGDRFHPLALGGQRLSARDDHRHVYGDGLADH